MPKVARSASDIENFIVSLGSSRSSSVISRLNVFVVFPAGIVSVCPENVV